MRIFVIWLKAMILDACYDETRRTATTNTPHKFWFGYLFGCFVHAYTIHIWTFISVYKFMSVICLPLLFVYSCLRMCGVIHCIGVLYTANELYFTSPIYIYVKSHMLYKYALAHIRFKITNNKVSFYFISQIFWLGFLGSSNRIGLKVSGEPSFPWRKSENLYLS